MLKSKEIQNACMREREREREMKHLDKSNPEK